MNAKQYLSQVIHIDQRIDNKLEQLQRLRESSTRATATLSDMPRPDSPDLQQLETTVAKIIDLERDINRDIDLLVDLKAEVRRVIGALTNPDQQLILEMRYLCYKPWTAIMEALEISETSVYRIHGEALKKIVVPEKRE